MRRRHENTIEAFAATDVGPVREQNEDAWLTEIDHGVFAVADGMGGHAAGEVASSIAIATVREILLGVKDPDETVLASEVGDTSDALRERLRYAMNQSSVRIRQEIERSPRYAGMGTTLVVLAVDGDSAHLAHVGDSRAYLVRGELIQQISEDHSLVNEQIKAGMITRDEAKHSRYKNIITRSVGFEEEVQVDVMGLVCEPNDYFVLCSDGLANLVEDKEIREVVSATTDIKDAPKRLIELANERGGDDNITVIVVKAVTA